MNFTRRCILGATFALALTPLAQAQATAGKWTERPIRLIVNFAAGGGTDGPIIINPHIFKHIAGRCNRSPLASAERQRHETFLN